jgi:hypothetical protein
LPKGDVVHAHATVEKLTAMHLTAMAEAFQRQLASPQFAELGCARRSRRSMRPPTPSSRRLALPRSISDTFMQTPALQDG